MPTCNRQILIRNLWALIVSSELPPTPTPPLPHPPNSSKYSFKLDISHSISILYLSFAWSCFPSLFQMYLTWYAVAFTWHSNLLTPPGTVVWFLGFLMNVLEIPIKSKNRNYCIYNIKSWFTSQHTKETRPPIFINIFIFQSNTCLLFHFYSY